MSIDSIWPFTPEELWEEFQRNVASGAGIMQIKNFLGSVDSYKRMYLNAAK